MAKVKPGIRGLLIETVRENPGIGQVSLWHMTRRKMEFPGLLIGGGNFFNRLSRMVKSGYLHKVLVKGMNHYYVNDGSLKEFEISDRTSVLVAADLVQETGNEQMAEAMRLGTRFK